MHAGGVKNRGCLTIGMDIWPWSSMSTSAISASHLSTERHKSKERDVRFLHPPTVVTYTAANMLQFLAATGVRAQQIRLREIEDSIQRARNVCRFSVLGSKYELKQKIVNSLNGWIRSERDKNKKVLACCQVLDALQVVVRASAHLLTHNDGFSYGMFVPHKA